MNDPDTNPGLPSVEAIAAHEANSGLWRVTSHYPPKLPNVHLALLRVRDGQVEAKSPSADDWEPIAHYCNVVEAVEVPAQPKPQRKLSWDESRGRLRLRLGRERNWDIETWEGEGGAAGPPAEVIKAWREARHDAFMPRNSVAGREGDGR